MPVAFDSEIDAQAGDHYGFGRAYGTSRWTDAPGGNGGSLSMPSVFLAHRVAHDDVTPGGGRRGGGSALLLEFMPRDDAPAGLPSSRLATVNFRFREPGSNEVVTQTVTVELPFGPDALPRIGHFDNPIVTKSFATLNIFTAMQLAADLFHLDHTVSTAERTLQRVMNAVRDYNDDLNDGQGDADMQSDLELLQMFVDAVRNGAPPTPPAPALGRGLAPRLRPSALLAFVVGDHVRADRARLKSQSFAAMRSLESAPEQACPAPSPLKSPQAPAQYQGRPFTSAGRKGASAGGFGFVVPATR